MDTSFVASDARQLPDLAIAANAKAGSGEQVSAGDVLAKIPRETRADLRLSAADARRRVEAGSATIVDLRSDAEYRAGHIPRAISVLPGEMDAKLSAIASRHEPVFLYCA